MKICQTTLLSWGTQIHIHNTYLPCSTDILFNSSTSV